MEIKIKLKPNTGKKVFTFDPYTAFHKYVSKCGIAVYVVVEKKHLDNGTFF